MNRTQLAAAVAEATGLSRAAAEEAVVATLDAIAGAVAKDDKVSLAGFGTFETRERAARTGRNPQTGESIEIAASKSVGFRPASALKDRLK